MGKVSKIQSETCQISKREFFCEKSEWLSAVKYFRQKHYILQMFDKILNISLLLGCNYTYAEKCSPRSRKALVLCRECRSKIITKNDFLTGAFQGLLRNFLECYFPEHL